MPRRAAMCVERRVVADDQAALRDPALIALDRDAGRRFAAGEPADARRGFGLEPCPAGRRQGLQRPPQKMRQAAQWRGCGEAVEGLAATDRRHIQPLRQPGRALHDGLDAARQHQRVAHRRIALDVGLLGIDQQPARPAARPASAAGPARSARRRCPGAPRNRQDRAASRPGAAAVRRGAGADAGRWAGWSAPCRDRRARPSSRRAPTAGWRAPRATASGDGRSTAPRHRRARPRRCGPALPARGPCCGRWRHRRA